MTLPTSPTSVVVSDTNVVSYIFNRDGRSLYYEERLMGCRQVISFQTLEEIRYGAYSNRWGARRMRDLLSYLENYEVIWPNSDLETISKLPLNSRMRPTAALHYLFTPS